MPFRSGATRYRQGTRNGRARRGRRSNLMSRVRYQRGTRTQQKRQITSLARMAVRSSRILAAHRIYQDWKLDSGINFAIPGWQTVPFMNPIAWEACLRRDLTPLTQSGCFLREMQFSYFMTNATKTLPSTISLFIVALRRQQSWDGSTMADNEEYITQGEGSQPIVNSGIFRVLFARTHQLFPPKSEINTGSTTGAPFAATGDPSTQYKKGKITIRLNTALRSPSDISWKQLSQEDMPFYNRLYLLAYFQNEDTSSATNAQMTYGLKYTTITQD